MALDLGDDDVINLFHLNVMLDVIMVVIAEPLLVFLLSWVSNMAAFFWDLRYG